eukprot:scaffold2858_cov659-Pavlova_lutheri.AAC.102
MLRLRVSMLLSPRPCRTGWNHPWPSAFVPSPTDPLSRSPLIGRKEPVGKGGTLDRCPTEPMRRRHAAMAVMATSSAGALAWRWRGGEGEDGWKADVSSAIALLVVLHAHPGTWSEAVGQAMEAWTSHPNQHIRHAVARAGGGFASQWILEQASDPSRSNAGAMEARKKLLEDPRTATVVLQRRRAVPTLLRAAAKEGRYGPTAALLALVAHVPLSPRASEEDMDQVMDMARRGDTPWALWALAGWCEASRNNCERILRRGGASQMAAAAAGKDADAQWLAARAIAAVADPTRRVSPETSPVHGAKSASQAMDHYVLETLKLGGASTQGVQEEEDKSGTGPPNTEREKDQHVRGRRLLMDEDAWREAHGFVAPLLSAMADAASRRDAAVARAAADALRACVWPSRGRQKAREEILRRGGLPLLHLLAAVFDGDDQVQAAVAHVVMAMADAGMPREEIETWMPTLYEWKNESDPAATRLRVAAGGALASLGAIDEWLGARRDATATRDGARAKRLKEEARRCAASVEARAEAVAAGAVRICAAAVADALRRQQAGVAADDDALSAMMELEEMEEGGSQTSPPASGGFTKQVGPGEETSPSKGGKQTRAMKAQQKAQLATAAGIEGVQRQAARLLAVLSSDERLRAALQSNVHHRWSGIVLWDWLKRCVRSDDLKLASHASKALAHLAPAAEGGMRYDDDVHLLTPHLPEEADRFSAVDIVFVHGLRGGAFNTWRTAHGVAGGARRDTCWPWLLLSKDMPQARILAVNYATTLSNWGGRYSRPLAEIAHDLLPKLIEAGVGQRPVIFVAHSMGGLVVKDMLVRSAEVGVGGRNQGVGIASLAQNTRGVVFYSVPHYGSWIADWAGGGPTRVFRPAPAVQDLKTTSPYLESINEWLWNKCKQGKIAVLSLSEGKATPLLEIWPQAGVTVKAGVVPMESAFPGYGRFVVLHAKDHMNICKPSDRDDASYTELLKFFNELQPLSK